MSATTSFAADPDSQTIKARDSFELIRRLGDVVLRKQTVKRNEATAQIDKLLKALKFDATSLSREGNQQAKQICQDHCKTLATLRDELAIHLNTLIDCCENVKENLATAEATLIAAGTDDDAGATSNLTHLSLEDLLQRAEALTVADADLVKETSISYEDLVDN